MKKAAVIGLGDISPIHIQAIMKNPGIELTAVCDIDEQKKEQAPEGVPFYTDYEKMIDEKRPDVVHICLPHYLHVPVSMAAAQKTVHVLCEKPVAMNTKEAVAFLEFEASHPDIHIGICLQNRFNETVEMLKDLLDSGEYGPVTALKGIVPWARPKEYYQKAWRGQWAYAGGGCMINQSVHTLDLLYHLGGEIAGVKASVSQLLDYGIEVEDTVCANLSYKNGAKGLFFATNANYKNESVQLSVQTEKAEFSIVEHVLYCTMDGKEPKYLAENAKMPGTKFYYGASHGKLIGKFYDALEHNSQDYLHVRDAQMSIRLIDAILQSGKENRYVPI